MEQVEVWEMIDRDGKGCRYQQYRLKLSFLPPHYYQVYVLMIQQSWHVELSQSQYVVTPGQVLQCVEKRFVRRLVSAVNRQVKLLRDKRYQRMYVCMLL